MESIQIPASGGVPEARTRSRAKVVAIGWFLATCVVQAIRVRHGVDFNDEMQYYGQIAALVRTGRLFTADLFFQQLVYVLVLPLFTLYHAVLGDASLILFGRLVFSTLVLGVYLFAFLSLRRWGVTPAIAGLCGFVLTFAIPLYNIYAISYNTVALAGVAVLAAMACSTATTPSRAQLACIAAVLACILLAYAPLAIVFGCAVCLYVGTYASRRDLAVFIVMGLAMASIAGLCVLAVASFEDLGDSLQFSSAFGVGTPPQMADMLVILAPVGCGLLGVAISRTTLPDLAFARGIRAAIAVLSVLAIVHLVVAAVVQHHVWGASVFLACWAFLVAGATSNASTGRALRCMLVIYTLGALTFSVTSSNGMKQAHGIAMMAAAFCVAIAAQSIGASRFVRPPAVAMLAIGTLVTAISIWLANPYRDLYLWEQSATVDRAEVFRHIAVTPSKATAIAFAQRELGDIAGKRVLVIGAHPWIYFATGAHPETSMIFMHLIGADAGYAAAARRLAGLSPDVIVVSGAGQERMMRASAALIEKRSLKCARIATPAELVVASRALQAQNDLLPVLQVCRGPDARS